MAQITKAERIRRYYEKRPDATIAQVAKALAKYGVTKQTVYGANNAEKQKQQRQRGANLNDPAPEYGPLVAHRRASVAAEPATKSEHVRRYLSKFGDVPPAEVVKALASQGVDVRGPMVSQLKNQMRKSGKLPDVDPPQNGSLTVPNGFADMSRPVGDDTATGIRVNVEFPNAIRVGVEGGTPEQIADFLVALRNRAGNAG